jgi:hypothetical protein
MSLLVYNFMRTAMSAAEVTADRPSPALADGRSARPARA